MSRILLVDDEVSTHRVLGHMLALDGHTCDGATDGVRGLQLLRNSEYDVLFVNWRMPVMDGVAMVHAAQSITQGRIPVIFSTGNPVFDGDPAGLLSSGRVDFFQPLLFELADLRATFAGALRLRTAWLSRRLLQRRVRRYPDAPPPLPFDRVTAPQRVVDRLTRAFEKASLPRLRELHLVRSPAEGIAVVAQRLETYPTGCSIPRELTRLLGDSGVGPLDGAPTPNEADVRRVAVADVADTIHGLPVEERDASLLALLLAIPERVVDPPRGGGAPEPEGRLGALLRVLAEDLGWLWVFEDGFVVATQPRVAVRRDAAGRLHAEAAPAIEYADGSGVYALQGHRVPARAVLRPRELTIADVRSAQNAEKRRILRGLLGEERYRREVVAKVVSVDTIPVLATDRAGPSLTRALVEDATGARTLVASDGSTDRVYYMRVPRWCRTCADAAEALSGRPEMRILAEA